MSGHAFVRPGQVSPDYPPPDACMVCGLPEAGHQGAELAARRTAAAAVLADFQTAMGGRPDGAAGWQAWQDWALRLAQHMQLLLEVTCPSAGPGRHAATGSWVGPDGTATLTHEDVGLVVAALRIAVDVADPDDRYELAALAYRLGDDR